MSWTMRTRKRTPKRRPDSALLGEFFSKTATKISEFMHWLNGPNMPLWLFTILVAVLFVSIIARGGNQ